MTQRKIKIADIDDLRIQIDRLYETQYPEIEEAISTNQKWQMNLVSVSMIALWRHRHENY